LSGENVSNDSLNISGLDVGFAPHLSKLAKVIDHHGVIIARHNRRRSVTHCTQPPQQTTQPVSSQTSHFLAPLGMHLRVRGLGFMAPISPPALGEIDHGPP
jgi:hypothetical protein